MPAGCRSARAMSISRLNPDGNHLAGGGCRLPWRVSRKSEAIARRLKPFEGGRLPAHYLAFLDCFNRQEFYEAHDFLEDLWLPRRSASDGAFYKGLIQLAGAFVHVQKDRPASAVALLRLARANLSGYPSEYGDLNLQAVLDLTRQWEARLSKTSTTRGIFEEFDPPSLRLNGP
jgi:hypothetical protein